MAKAPDRAGAALRPQLDPNEAENRIAGPDLEPVAGELRGRLERWMPGTGDPLLDGPVPSPAGAEFNDPDGRSAAETPLRAR
jgi:N-sulfoglucosamine sulfohydrolase